MKSNIQFHNMMLSILWIGTHVPTCKFALLWMFGFLAGSHQSTKTAKLVGWCWLGFLLAARTSNVGKAFWKLGPGIRENNPVSVCGDPRHDEPPMQIYSTYALDARRPLRHDLIPALPR
jgi:hypothetical protein